MDRNLSLDVLWVTELAAIAAARWCGRGDKNAADGAATEAMRKALGSVAIRGKVVIGEGELDEAPMLYIGEPVGLGQPEHPAVDIAVDPLEGTNLCAKNGPGAITVIAMAQDGGFLHAPDMYMLKIAVGPVGRGLIDITQSATWNLQTLAKARDMPVAHLNAIILDRPRHRELIEEVRTAGARVQLISDGDLMAAIATARPGSGVDILFGSGGAPEGVIAAAALRCLGGDMQGILKPDDEAQAARAVSMTGKPIDHVYSLTEMAKGDVMFAASGVTDGPVLRGVRYRKDGITVTHSIAMRSKSGNVRMIEQEHRESPPP